MIYELKKNKVTNFKMAGNGRSKRRIIKDKTFKIEVLLS